MKLKNLFETEVLIESEEKNLIGLKIGGKIIDENTPVKPWPRDFFCSSKGLTSLEGSPSKVGGDFWCNNNELTSLEGAPSKVGGDFFCYTNQLTSLEGAPSQVGGHFSCSNNKLTSLHNIHKIIKKMNGDFSCVHTPIKSHVLGLMLIPGITEVRLDNEEVETILNDGIENEKHWTEVQADLEEAGFEEYAQL